MTQDAQPMDHLENEELLDIESTPIENEYEEISSDEVDRIVQALESLIDETTSENIRAYLDEAAENIYRLVYDEDAAGDAAVDVEDAAEWEADDDLAEAA